MVNARRTAGVVVSVAIVVGLFAAAFAQAATTVTEYPLPTASSDPVSITTGPDGALWFSDNNTGKVGRITTGGTITEFSSGITAGGTLQTIATGPDGNLWFTEVTANKVAKITPAGAVTEFSAGGSHPWGIAKGPDGYMWVTLNYPSGAIVKIGTDGTIAQTYSVAGGYPTQITAGPDGNLWFALPGGSGATIPPAIGRITPAGVISIFSSGITGAPNQFGILLGPEDIAAGPDGNLWFTEPTANKIGRITPTGTVTEFSTGITAGSSPLGITAGPDGNVWFTEGGGDRLGRITPSGTVTEFSSGITAGSNPDGITAGPDGNIWFTEFNGNRIGVLGPGSPPPVPTNTGLPSITGTALPGNRIRCAIGTWSAAGAPISYTYQWYRDGVPIPGATSATYTVMIGDEATTLSCWVTASTSGGSTTAKSPGVIVAQRGTLICEKPSGRLTNSTVGALSLGESRKAAREALRHYHIKGAIDDFCLYGGWGIRVGYTTSKLLKQPGARKLKDKIVLALTANIHYNLGGVTQGTTLRDAMHKLKLGKVHHTGLNDWYVTADGRGVLKVRKGMVQEVGIANTLFTTHGYKAQGAFLNGFSAA